MEHVITEQRVKESAEFLRQHTPFETADIGLVLGSGLGGIYAALERAVTVEYAEIPYMVPSTAPLHAGRFVIGTLAGKKVVCMQGRLHAYEGNSAQQIAYPIFIMNELGIDTLCVTNAAGGINAEYGVGDLMLISDHINLQGLNPCAGPVAPGLYPRFFDMTHAYSPRLRNNAMDAARRLGLNVHEGVYIGVLGPSFETPAEIRAFRALGADAVGMSTVCEVIAANALGMQVLGISMISNPAAGVCDEPLDMNDVERAAQSAAKNVEELIRETFR